MPRNGRVEKDLIERVRRGLQFGQNLHHYVVAIELSEILGHLSLAERIVKDVVDQLRLNAKTRRLVAVNRERQSAAARLLVGCDVPQRGKRL